LLIAVDLCTVSGNPRAIPGISSASSTESDNHEDTQATRLAPDPRTLERRHGRSACQVLELPVTTGVAAPFLILDVPLWPLVLAVL
jgi:hypothetical protein